MCREAAMSVQGELISTAELEKMLGRPDLRIFDCTTRLEYLPPGSDAPYQVVPGRDTFEDGHIPGAGFLDLQGEFSNPDTRLRFMMAATAQLETAFGRHGVGNDSFVVLYSIGTAMWATRFWWMLKSLGFDRVAVLDGGLDKWKAEGRPLESGPGQAARDIHRETARGIFRRQPSGAGRGQGSQQGSRQRCGERAQRATA
jgi:thiosulfate/3-mercaptopyruvate sulfurtransferase